MDRTITFHQQNFRKGRGSSNESLVCILAVLPPVAASTSVKNGLALGCTALLTLTVSSACVYLMRSWLRSETRLPVIMIISASLITAIELAMNAYFHGLYTALGIYPALISITCALIGYAEDFASRRNLLDALRDATVVGAVILLVLTTLGGVRALLGHGLTLAALAPGAFIGIGVLVALANATVRRLRAGTATPASASSQARTQAP